MNQKFSKKELERLGCTEEEIKLVMEYQKKLPIIVDEDFIIDARELHLQLGVGKRFATWIKDRIEKYSFIVDVDYKIHYESDVPNYGNTDFTILSPNQLARMEIRIEYSLTSNMAKELCLIERTEIGKIARKYFILIEDLVKRNKEWWQIRNPEKANYIPMCNAISESIHRTCGRYGDEYDFRRDADFINIIATGSRAQSIKNYLGIGVNALTRDSLLTDYNEKIAFLQEQNILLLSMDLPIIKRMTMLISFFDTKYPNAKPLQDYHDRDWMLKARKSIFDELNK